MKSTNVPIVPHHFITSLQNNSFNLSCLLKDFSCLLTNQQIAQLLIKCFFNDFVTKIGITKYPKSKFRLTPLHKMREFNVNLKTDFSLDYEMQKGSKLAKSLDAIPVSLTKCFDHCI